MRRKVFVLAPAVLAVAMAQSPAVPPSDIEDLVRSAIERNRELEALRQRLSEAQALLRQAGVRPAPAIEVTSASGRLLGTRGEEEYSAGYFQPIETGGKRDKRLSVARKSVELAEAELAERIRQLTFEVKSRYIDALAEQNKIESIDRLLAVGRESFRLTRARVEQGDAAPLERELLVVELNRAESQRVATSGRVGAALVELQTICASPALPVLAEDLRANGTDYPLPPLQKRALASRPDLRIARILEQQGGAEVDLAEALGRPDITLSAEYARRHTQLEDPLRKTAAGPPLLLPDRDNIVKFGISVPLLTRGRNRGNIEAAASRAAAARLRREHLERSVPLEVEAAWRRWRAARSALDLFNRGVIEQSQRNLAVIRQAYNLGQLRMLDVLNEQRRLIDTELAYIEAKAGLARAEAELERAVGGGLR